TLFTRNTARSNGGGIFNWNSSSPSMINSTMYGNTATNGGAFYNIGVSSPVISNAVIWGNSPLLSDQSAIISYSNVESPSFYPGTGNLKSNPLFYNVDDADGPDNIWGTSDDGLTLLAGSTASNSGNNGAIPAGITGDISGTVRIQQGTVDRGAYEGSSCTQSVLYVDNSISRSGNGGTWATAFKEVREALAVASQCSNVNTIHVAKGTYLPTDDGDRDVTFPILRGGLKIYGGYPSGGGTRNAAVNATTLSGDLGNAFDNSDNSYHVVVIAGVGAGADSLVLDGFIIKGGNANGSAMAKNYNGFGVQRNEGGGLYLRSNAANGKVAIRNCVIFDNATGTYGGGFLNHLSSPSITNCVLTNNQASSGAGMFNFNNSSPAISNSIFIQNTAQATGGGMYNWNNVSPIILNCTFTGNVATHGGAIANTSATPVVTNSIIWNNSSSFNDETATVTYSIVDRTLLYPGTGNLKSNPSFLNPADPNGADNIFGTAETA
ncbi:MAG TPA: hypothetical protein PLY70_04530, partial [Saprospiraceae bacterium]|nr:hypothetical protein [Saprospiraceae bacterium]